MRFCKQRDRYSCGAIAALNIDKFRGCRVTYEDLPYYRDLVRCRKEWNGTFARNITRVYGQASRRSWNETRKFLRSGNCIIVLTCRKSWGHFFLMALDQYGCIVVINRKRDIHIPSTVQILPHAAAILLKHAHRTWYVEKERLL